jgi:molybdopterin synthase catalytic subunit
MFSLSNHPLDPSAYQTQLQNPTAGALATFQGWVRNHNQDRDVRALEYEAYPAMCQKEADRIIDQAKRKFDILDIHTVHRIGRLAIGDMAVYIGVTAEHRQPAFDACQYLIDQIKIRLPIWEKEIYIDGDSGWVKCEHCAQVEHTHAH